MANRHLFMRVLYISKAGNKYDYMFDARIDSLPLYRAFFLAALQKMKTVFSDRADDNAIVYENIRALKIAPRCKIVQKNRPKCILHTNRPVSACLWTVDRWWCDGPGPGSNAVLYQYNLLCSVLPTAAKDNMFHPLRAYSEAVPLLLCTCSLRAAAATNRMIFWCLDYFALGIFANFVLFYLPFVSKQKHLQSVQHKAAEFDSTIFIETFMTTMTVNIFNYEIQSWCILKYPTIKH